MSVIGAIKGLIILAFSSFLFACGGSSDSPATQTSEQPVANATSSPSATPTSTPTSTPRETQPPRPGRLAKYEPAGDEVLVFVGQDNATVGSNFTYTDGYADNLSVPAGITHYLGFAGSRVVGLSFTANWGAGPMNLKHYVDSDLLEGTIMHVAIDMVDAEELVASGAKDSLITELADFMNSYPEYPFLLRIGYEFDGGHNRYVPDDWRRAWIRIVDKLREAGVTNFATMMHALSMDTPENVWNQFYPGDDYVDWLGYSYWSGSSTTAPSLEYARRLNKPVCLCESSPVGFDLEQGNGEMIWNSWFVNYFDHIESNSDVVRAISYISLDWPSQPLWVNSIFFNTTDGRIHVNPFIETNWLNKMAEPGYIHTPDGVYDLIGF